LSKSSKYKQGWKIYPFFKIKLHKRDIELLKRIKSYFNEVGKVGIYDNYSYYHVSAKDELIKVIIPHLDKYSLLTQKQNDFILFKKIMNLIDKGEHLNKEGLNKIITLKASLNKGLSEKLKILYPNIEVIRPNIIVPSNIDYN